MEQAAWAVDQTGYSIVTGKISDQPRILFPTLRRIKFAEVTVLAVNDNPGLAGSLVKPVGGEVTFSLGHVQLLLVQKW